MIFTKDKSFYHEFFPLFVILVVQNVIVLSVNLADNIMLGAYSETALSGVAIVNQIQFLLQQLMMGIGDGLVILASQYWGKQEMQPIRKLSSIAVFFALFLAAILFLAVSFFPKQVLYLFTKDILIIEEGMRYLSIIRFSYLIFGLSTILLATLRSVQNVKVAIFTSVLSFFVNCGINYLLIYGKMGFPEMGVRGAAIGTLCARILECAVILCYLKFVDKKCGLCLKDYFSIDRLLFGDYLKVCLPILVIAGLWGLSTALQTVILGHMTSSAIAANSMASTLFMILKVAIVGAASATAVVIGKTIGSGRIDKVKEYAKTLQLLFLGIGILTSLTLYLLRTPILHFYHLSPETKALANQFLLILCVTCIGTSYQLPVLSGIVRGGGDTRFMMINDLISIWGIVLPVSFLAAFVFHWSPAAVVVCLNSDQIFKCAAACIKVNRYRWIKELTRP